MPARSSGKRPQATSERKRGLILEAARQVFESEGLDGASLRAIAAVAGYTPAALYFYFDSKEAIYGELLRHSLVNLEAAINHAITRRQIPPQRLRAAAMAFFRYYQENPRDLDLGFYLFRGGMKPRGLGRQRDRMLNAALDSALSPIGHAVRELGGTPAQARQVTIETFAYATGLLLLAHTGRMRRFGASTAGMMQRFIERAIAGLTLEESRQARRRPRRSRPCVAATSG